MSLAVQLQDTGNVVAALGAPLLLTELVSWCRGCPRPALENAGLALFAAACAVYGIGALMRAQWTSAAVNFAIAAYLAWLLWRRWRKHRKRAAAPLGAKSRALLAALVRKARDAAKPRPVLRPQPQAGGW